MSCFSGDNQAIKLANKTVLEEQVASGRKALVGNTGEHLNSGSYRPPLQRFRTVRSQTKLLNDCSPISHTEICMGIWMQAAIDVCFTTKSPSDYVITHIGLLEYICLYKHTKNYFLFVIVLCSVSTSIKSTTIYGCTLLHIQSNKLQTFFVFRKRRSSRHRIRTQL
jgi:hypothetical protein